jgi:hypothetical protein
MPTAADYASQSARDAGDAVKKLEKRVAALEKLVRKLITHIHIDEK